MVTKQDWKLEEWNAHFATNHPKLILMSQEEVREAIKYLRDNNYPKPSDCPKEKCPKYRPACNLSICNIAVGMCGDF